MHLTMIELFLLTWYDIRIVFLSEAETKAMAWNLKKSFTSQVKQRRKAERAESPNASIPPGNQTED